MADYSSGLAIIDISEPTNPGIPIYEDTTGNSQDVYISGDYAYMADEGSGLAIIDISDPTNPGTPLYEDTTGATYGVHICGDYAYIADTSSGLAVIDISDPTNPGTPILDISWTATDLFPGIYTIEMVGSGIVVGPITWTSGDPITYDIPDGLAPGIYSFTITITDNNGNSASSTITITITEGTRGGISFGDSFLLISALTIVILIYMRKRKIEH